MAPVQIDPFLGVSEALQQRIHASFVNTVAQRRFVKVPMTTALFQAVWRLLGGGSPLHELERTLFLLYYVGGFRAATFTLSSDKRGWARLVKIGHVSFFTDPAGRRAAFEDHASRLDTCCGRTLAAIRSAAGGWRDASRRHLRQPTEPTAIQPKRLRRALEDLRGRGGVAVRARPTFATFVDHRDVNSQLSYVGETFEAPGVTADHLYHGV
eukprot:SAG11_NODE_914_length_6565_cov_8.318126_2_plen_211_part_00